jgi:polysaccharide pyruvyl transferase WcaK-like protein
MARAGPVVENATSVRTSTAAAHRGRTIPKNVVILAGDTDGNLGDLAIVTATCQQLRSLHPDVRISLLTAHPERDSRRLGIAPLRRGLRSCLSFAKAVHQADLVICGGGGLFQDDDSLLKMPYWALRLLVVRLLTKRIAGLSIGAGPLGHPLSRFACRLALTTLDPITVRDGLAEAVLQPLTRKRVDVVPDPAFVLEAAPVSAAIRLLIEAGVPLNKPIVGVAVRRWFHMSSNIIPHKYATRFGIGRRRGEASMEKFRQRMVAALRKISCDTGAHILFLPTYNVRHEDDAAVCEAIGLELPAGTCTTVRIDNPALYKAVTGMVSVMLCGRMHPAILAASNGTPVIGLAYNPKFFGMFSLLGQDTRCMSLNDFNATEDSLVAMLEESISHPQRFRPDTSKLEEETREFIGWLVAPQTATATQIPQPQAQHY